MRLGHRKLSVHKLLQLYLNVSESLGSGGGEKRFVITRPLAKMAAKGIAGHVMERTTHGCVMETITIKLNGIRSCYNIIDWQMRHCGCRGPGDGHGDQGNVANSSNRAAMASKAGIGRFAHRPCRDTLLIAPLDAAISQLHSRRHLLCSPASKNKKWNECPRLYDLSSQKPEARSPFYHNEPLF